MLHDTDYAVWSDEAQMARLFDEALLTLTLTLTRIGGADGTPLRRSFAGTALPAHHFEPATGPLAEFFWDPGRLGSGLGSVLWLWLG